MQELAEYYGIAVIPARVRKPQDEAKLRHSCCLEDLDVKAARGLDD